MATAYQVEPYEISFSAIFLAFKNGSFIKLNFIYQSQQILEDPYALQDLDYTLPVACK